MEGKTEEFIQLIDRALSVAEPMLQTGDYSGRLENVISGLQMIRTKTLNGTLERSGKITNLGLAREVADWIEPLDSPLLKAVGAIEDHYQKYL